MKKIFSTKWKASKQPRKQRKYAAKAPLHLKRKQLSVNLSKKLRTKNSKRNIVVRKGDVVRILRGKFKKKEGKVLEVNYQNLKVMVENIQKKKLDGSKVNVPMRPSNLQIIELNLDDKKRIKGKTGHIEKEIKKVETKENAHKETKSAK